MSPRTHLAVVSLGTRASPQWAEHRPEGLLSLIRTRGVSEPEFGGARLPGRGGVAGWLLASTKGLEVSYATRQHVGSVEVGLALGWSTLPETHIRSFVNFSETKTGSHVDGLWQGLAGWARELGIEPADAEAVTKRALAPGLTAILHIGLLDPKFGGPTRDHLVTPLAATAVGQALASDVTSALRRNGLLRDFLAARLRGEAR